MNHPAVLRSLQSLGRIITKAPGHARAIAALAAFGLLLRLYEYAILRSIRGDEAKLFFNIDSRTWLELLEPLDFDQGAPIGFLWIEKLVWTLFGGHELAMRLWPLMAGSAALLLFAVWAYRTLEPGASLAAVAVFAIAQQPIFYSSDLKQYSTDLAVAAALYLAMPAATGPSRSGWRRAGLYLLAALAPWFSHPSVFVVAGIGTAQLTHAARNHDRAGFRGMAAFCAVAAASFLIEYRFVLSALAGSAFLVGWWEFAFMPFPPTSLQDLWWFDKTVSTSWRAYTTTITANVLPPLVLAGAVALFRRRRPLFWALALPVAFTLGASAAHLYPFHQRLILFLFPVTAAFTGAGFSEGLRLGRRRAVSVALGLAIALFVPPLTFNVRSLASTERRVDMRRLLTHLKPRFRSNDCLILHRAAHNQFQYYAPRFGLDHPEQCIVMIEEWDPFARARYQRLRVSGRAWFLFSHAEPELWECVLSAERAARSVEQERLIIEDAALFLFRMADAPSAARLPLSPATCGGGSPSRPSLARGGP
jgi:hypothetical protein